jgi:phenylpyruvate tautomerase PptA (4-oxalocrotonate tautomerase family)
MPLIDLTYPQGALTPEARTALADELTAVRVVSAPAHDREQAVQPAGAA